MWRQRERFATDVRRNFVVVGTVVEGGREWVVLWIVSRVFAVR